MLEIELNGAPHRLAGATLLDLAESLGVAGQMVALAVNRNVVPHSRWHACTLQDHDKVDLVRAIGGG
ncbi:sulfur carrier protein ThiS [Massilia agilis]|uniref:Sulfur carrier protein ThiS n=1 Tax=Massilia agilis TaxID=1811226 RepID=A0ABT2DDM1_9BURK|nr:sulfur carrier protein ThiS [Massilia agilis]MCS0809428.1 sulfur carrier protein ThiS [Massilia agilis]